MNTMNTNGRTHDGATNTNGHAHDGADFWAVEIDLLLGEADPDETRPLARILGVRGQRICWTSPESKGEVAEGPQLRTVEAMCEANWPAQRRSTEVERATLERRHQWSWWSLLRQQQPLLRLKPRQTPCALG
jgi:hypothetical protein